MTSTLKLDRRPQTHPKPNPTVSILLITWSSLILRLVDSVVVLGSTFVVLVRFTESHLQFCKFNYLAFILLLLVHLKLVLN